MEQKKIVRMLTLQKINSDLQVFAVMAEGLKILGGK